MKKTIALASLLALALGASAAHAAKFYKWTDDKGVTHYTVDPPPAGAKSSEVRVKTRSYSDAEDATAAGQKGGAAAKSGTGAGTGKPAAGKEAAGGKPAATRSGDGKDAKPAPGQYAEKCKALRSNLQSMEEHARVKVQEANGEVRVLTEEEKAARLDATQREIKAYCE
jgi:hypothetical protein